MKDDVGKVLCKERVRAGSDGWRATYKPCSRTAGPSGYCGQHDPEKKAARRDASYQKWLAQSKASSAKAHLERAAPDLLEALKKIEKALRTDSRQKTIGGDDVEYHLDGATMSLAINAARAAISKATTSKD